MTPQSDRWRGPPLTLPVEGFELPRADGTLERNLMLDSGSVAYVSPDLSSKRMIVFVHGYGGHPTTTWSKFHDYASSRSGIDSLFCAFETKKYYIESLATHLLALLESLHDGSWQREVRRRFGVAFGQAAGREYQAVAYEHVVLVCHSMGCVVARQAIVDAETMAVAGMVSDRGNTSGWLSTTDSLFFAPAHAGSRIPGYGLKLLNVIRLESLGAVVMAMSKVEQDLQEGSLFLTKLRERAEMAAKNSRAARAVCVFGANDRVVVPIHFDCDTRDIPDAVSHGHVSICKPTFKWTRPTRLLRAFIGGQ